MNLYDKYKIEKKSGEPVDPQAQYFVLRIDKDLHARIALKAYADSVRASDPVFADELQDWLEKTYKPSPGADDVYSHPDCIFNYCPSPDECRVRTDGCLNPSRGRLANK